MSFFLCVIFFLTNQLYTVIKGISSFFFHSFIKNTLILGLSPQGLAKLSNKPQNELAPKHQTQGLSIPVLPIGTKNRIKAFKTAYDAVGKGLPFVFICKIRRRLNWPREPFDQLLAEGYIVAHTGNPGDLSTEDVIDSYQDRYGDLYITANWRQPV